MHKSISTPNLQGNHKMGNERVGMGMRKSISTNALPELNVMDAMIVTRAPINQSFTCLASTDFPDNILKGKIEVDKDLVSCLVTPCEPPVEQNERITTNTIGRNYLQMSTQNESLQERYHGWLRRLRKRRGYNNDE